MLENAPARPLPPGDRLSRLSAAGLRINESLDVDAALQAVMDSARSLANAPYAAIITLDDSGAVDDHLVLGFDPGEVERLRFVEALADAGITPGCGVDPPAYCPDPTVTRAQMAGFLARPWNRRRRPAGTTHNQPPEPPTGGSGAGLAFANG